MAFELSDVLTPEDRAVIVDGLASYNTKRIGYDDYRALNLVMRNDSGVVIGGLTGETYWDWFFVDLLWVAEAHRKQKLGSELLNRAEAEAKARGCTNAYLDTFDFQARGFYEKLGYMVFGSLPKYPGEHTRYFLTKAL